MGQVYRARDPRLQREVALKVLHGEVAGDPDRRRRFAQEARAASALNHPNIVTVHDFAEENGVAYIVTELVDGESLAAMLERGPLPVKKALDIAAQVTEGLAAAHEAGIVHRDIKPANIMVARSGLVKILDFGLAKHQARTSADQTLTAETTPGMVMGTVTYMSPEQGMGQPLDFRTDQFSFGLVLYRMLTGQAAFERTSPMSTLAAIIEQDHKPVGELNPAIPVPLRWCVDRCLSKEREHRYASTRDLHRELATIRQNLSQMSGSQPAIAPAAAPHPKRRAYLVPAVVGLAALLCGAAIANVIASPYKVDLASYVLQPLATEAPYQAMPAWSHDGRNIAFVAEVNGVRQVFARDLASPMAAQLTRGTVDCEAPFWSADGARIFFLQRPAGASSLWAVGAAGGAPEMVRENVSAASLAPDGKTLAFLRADPAGADPLSLWIAGLDGKEPRKFTAGPFATRDYRSGEIGWSPDGHSLGAWLARWDGRSEFWIVPQPDGKPELSFGLAQGTYPFSWMHDNRHVVFGGLLPGTLGADLQMADTRKQEIVPLTVTTRDAVYPSVSPDGLSIAFTATDNDSDLMEVPFDGSPVKPLLVTSRTESDPTWMHSGDQFAYATDRTGASEIWMKNRRDGAERPLVSGRDFPKLWVLALSEPSFSPDDQRVAYALLGSDGHAVYVSNVRGGPPLRLSQERYDQRSPTWSPDGNWIAYLGLVNGRWALLKSRSGGVEKPVLVRDNLLPGHPKWSKRGDWISCVTREGLTMVRPDGSESRVISHDAWLTHGWDLEGSAIWGIKQMPDGKRSLARIDVATANERVVGEVGLPAHSVIGCYSLNPDGKAFAISIGRPEGGVWLLKGFPQPKPFWRRLLP
jgi:Tol biopolymer transport system component